MFHCEFGLSGGFAAGGVSVRLGDRPYGQAQSLDVERNGGVHLVLDCFTRAAGGDAVG